MTLNVKDLAKVGAQARLTTLKEEQAALLAMFPELRDGRAMKTAAAAPSASAPATKSRKRKPMSAAQKKAVGVRMKAYWAKRRAGKANGASEAGVVVSTGSPRKVGRKKGRRN